MVFVCGFFLFFGVCGWVVVLVVGGDGDEYAVVCGDGYFVSFLEL